MNMSEIIDTSDCTTRENVISPNFEKYINRLNDIMLGIKPFDDNEFSFDWLKNLNSLVKR